MKETEINYCCDCCSIQRKGETGFCNLCGGSELVIKVWTPELAAGAAEAVAKVLPNDDLDFLSA